MESPSIDIAIAFLEHRLATYSPEEYVFARIHSVRDIYEDRSTLKEITANDAVICHITGVIVEAVEKGLRMRTLECAKVLRALVRSIGDNSLSNETINRLFTVYKSFIFSNSEDVRWCISSVLKGRKLTDAAITWLISNADRSEHLVNRLLLYPEPNSSITSWVKTVYDRGLLPHRKAELIAILLTQTDVAQFATAVDPNTLAWAIYKSHMSQKAKIELLEQCSCLESFWSIVDIADRMCAQELLESFLQKLWCKVKMNGPSRL